MKKIAFILNGHVKTVEGIALIKPAQVAILNNAAEINSEFQERLRQAATLRIDPNTDMPSMLVHQARKDN